MADTACSVHDDIFLLCEYDLGVSLHSKEYAFSGDAAYGGFFLSPRGGFHCAWRDSACELTAVNPTLYLQPFLVSFSIAVFLLLLFRGALAWVKTSLPVRRWGGVAVIMAFLLAVVTHPHLVMTPVIVGMLVGSVMILFFGIWDDISTLDWKVQLFFQIFLGAMLFAFGMRIFSVPVPFVGQVFVNTLPGGTAIGCVLLVLWVVFVMNVLNWVDGIDGLLSSVSLLSLFALLFLALSPQVNQPPVGILSVALAGAVLGLLLFNVPPSRFFAGTSGSFFIGFAVASISVLSGTKIATALLVLSLPVLDALWVFADRLCAGVSPFRGGDARHLHYRLREIGWSDRRILLWYTFYTGVVGLLALSTGTLGKTFSFILVGVVVLSFLFWARKQTIALRAPQRV